MFTELALFAIADFALATPSNERIREAVELRCPHNYRRRGDQCVRVLNNRPPSIFSDIPPVRVRGIGGDPCSRPGSSRAVECGAPIPGMFQMPPGILNRRGG